MKPREFIAQYGIDYFNSQKGKTVTVRLLSDDGLVFSGFFVGVKQTGDEVPMVDGLLITLPQFKLTFMYKSPDDDKIVPVSINLLLVESMGDIQFSE